MRPFKNSVYSCNLTALCIFRIHFGLHWWGGFISLTISLWVFFNNPQSYGSLSPLIRLYLERLLALSSLICVICNTCLLENFLLVYECLDFSNVWSPFIYQVIANFSAAWCGPCRMLAPFYCDLSEKYPSLMFLLIDVDELTVSTEKYFVKSICHLPLYIYVHVCVCLFVYSHFIYLFIYFVQLVNIYIYIYNWGFIYDSDCPKKKLGFILL